MHASLNFQDSMPNTRGDNARLSSYPVTCTSHETVFSLDAAKPDPVHDMSISLYILYMYHVYLVVIRWLPTSSCFYFVSSTC